MKKYCVIKFGRFNDGSVVFQSNSEEDALEFAKLMNKNYASEDDKLMGYVPMKSLDYSD